MELLERKIDKFLIEWKQNPNRKPLIVKGARQIGKTESIRAFGRANYDSVLEMNFVLQKKFRNIFDDGYEVDQIIKNITILEPSWKIVPNKTLLFFDELQKCPNCATSLKSFCQDGRILLSRRSLRCDLLRFVDGYLLRGNRIECRGLQGRL